MRCLGRLILMVLLAAAAGWAYCYFTPFDEYWKARGLMKVKQTDRAIALYEEGIKRFPSSGMTPQARYELGMAFYERREYEKAAIHLRRALEVNPINPRGPEAQYTLGLCLLAVNKPGKAVVELGKVRQNYAAARDVVVKAELQLAQIYFDEGNYSAATRRARFVLENYGTTELAPAAQLLLGDIARDRGQSKKALAAYGKVIQKYPKSKEAIKAQYEIAKIYKEEKNYEEVAKAAKDLLRLTGNLGRKYLEDERVKGFLDDMKRAGESLLQGQ